jgi:hypothetical protein
MNPWTKKSVELVSGKYYLDKLSDVYPPVDNPLREISDKSKILLKKIFDSNNDVEFFEKLQQISKKEKLLFPIKDTFVASLKKGKKEIIDNNPETVSRITNSIRSMMFGKLTGFDAMIESMIQPKEVNRQMGPMFGNWLSRQEYPKVSNQEFKNSTSGIKILDGGDAELKKFAEEQLDYDIVKGLDVIAKVDTKYVIGEAKFLTDDGGHQNAQFKDAMYLLDNYNSTKAIAIAILDGVVWIKSKNKMYKAVCKQEKTCVSALLLDEFLESLR